MSSLTWLIPRALDGLIIWSAAIDFHLSPAEMEEFYRRYQPLPIVSVEREMAGLPSLVVDNKQAMSEVVSHLIEVHGYRRIAFIRGPEGHAGAQERYQGYVEALAQHGLPFDPTLVPPPTHWWSAEEATAGPTGCWTSTSPSPLPSKATEGRVRGGLRLS